MKMDAGHIGALEDLLRWRRDVRHFRTDPVPERLVEELRAAMDYVPSVGNARPWRVIRVSDAALRGSVADIFARCNAAAAGYPDRARAEYLNLKLAGIDRAPLQLAVFTETEPEEGRGLGRATMPETLAQSTAMAVHTLWLAARARNLGLGMVSILDRGAVERMFAVPESWRFAAYLCIGWPEIDDDMPLLHRSGWQENRRTEWEER